MDQETMLRRLMTPAAKNDGDKLFTHAVLPGLFRAAIVKPCNNKNKLKENHNYCRKKDTGFCSKHGVKRLGKSKTHLRSSNFSIADLILIAKSSDTLPPDQTRPVCPAYRFCVERAATAATTTSVAGVTVDQEDSIIGCEFPTLRDLLVPIKQTAMRMKQLSQVQDELPQGRFRDRASQTNNNVRRSPWKARTLRGPVVQNTFQTCLRTMIYFEEEDDNVSEAPLMCRKCGGRVPESRGEYNAFGQGDRAPGVDANVFVKIISTPEIEPDRIGDDPLKGIIQQIMAQMADRPQSGKKVGTRTTADQYRNEANTGIKSYKYPTEKPSASDIDSLSLQSYEFVKTTDIGCGDEPERKKDDEICQKTYKMAPDGGMDSFLLHMLAALKNTQEEQSKKQDTISEKTSRMEPKSKTFEEQDKSIGCGCINPDPSSVRTETKAASKFEVTNKVSFKSSYVFENLETMNVENSSMDRSNQPACCLKDVATSKISIYKQITSMSQSKVTRTRKRSCSSQCDIEPGTFRKMLCNSDYKGGKEVELQKISYYKSQDDGLPETIDELCACGCGFFLEGDDSCSCGCAVLVDSPCQLPRHTDSEGYSIDSMQGLIMSRKNAKLEEGDSAEHCYSCGCTEDPGSRKDADKIQNCENQDNCSSCVGSVQDPGSCKNDDKPQTCDNQDNCSSFDGCTEQPETKCCPCSPIVKPANDKCEISKSIEKCQELKSQKQKKVRTSCDDPTAKCKVLKTGYNKVDKRTNLEEEARKLQQKIQSYKEENDHFRKLIEQCNTCNDCQKTTEELSRIPPIRATYSGLATAIEILQAKCRSKDNMIAVLAEGLRGVANYAQIAKNLAAPCLEYTYWDFDQCALYTYLRGTISKLSVKGSKDSLKGTSKGHYVPPPTDFKIGQQFCRCLFVSWKLPENLENIAGYRIYVNGTLATSVRCPTRTETILGFLDTKKPAELALHSVDKNDALSEPVTATYYPEEQQ